MANKKTQHDDDVREMLIAGAGLAALAAGVYFFLGPDGKKHQKNMKGWMVRMKGEVLEKIEEVDEITEPLYNDIIDTIAQTYEVADKIPRDEIALLATDLKRQWKTISRTLSGKKKAKKSSTKTIKKSRAKKSTPKKKTTTKKSQSK